MFPAQRKRLGWWMWLFPRADVLAARKREAVWWREEQARGPDKIDVEQNRCAGDRR